VILILGKSWAMLLESCSNTGPVPDVSWTLSSTSRCIPARMPR